MPPSYALSSPSSPFLSPFLSPSLSSVTSSLYLSSAASLSSLSLSSLDSSSSSEPYISDQTYMSPRSSCELPSASTLLRWSFPASLTQGYDESPCAERLDSSIDAKGMLSSGKTFEKIENFLKTVELDELGEILKDLILEAGHYKEKFVFDLVQKPLERLFDLPRDLPDVLRSMVNNRWISNDEIRGELESIISLCKDNMPAMYSAEIDKIHENFKKEEAKLTCLSKSFSGTHLEKLCRQGIEYLYRVTAFFDDFYNGTDGPLRNAWLFMRLIGQPLNFVNFIASQYIYPSMQRRWQ